ncbi:hypothetical protein A3D78_04445 [Candidatus Gottesmanbacteria bacterium RIFCSPHIGHO2_02_FULL_39_14]|uniref:Glycosyltransferase RgtA/B/C/D-like domain-containing protein n=1 Tax=Candidatus Gottesmanbacteria bacterium RIFCSPHIGHO2_02_FULL_39_14 TaxID=1798383 RepID=A0A1F6A312_9BACT|nr:MAG: hypothetical protein A3D78_04445 [Candidatus Gottesmanbacteria bacterium RIFCSPHIGHO2_02_FULL_39_14]
MEPRKENQNIKSKNLIISKIMIKAKKLYFYLLLTILLHGCLFFYKYYQTANIQQDNYVGYAKAFKTESFISNISEDDSRLFPGLPLLIYIFNFLTGSENTAGLFLSFLSLLTIFLFSVHFTKNTFYAFWITVFPPIIFEQTSKISTEAITIALFIISYYLIINKKYRFSALLLGFASIVRLISISMFIGLLILLFRRKKYILLVQSSVFYMLFPLFMLVFNFFHWGWGGIFRQITMNQIVGRGTLTPVQLINDILRTISWKQPQILISGMVNIILFFSVFYSCIRYKNDFLNSGDQLLVKVWAILSLILVFSIGPTPFLEEASRYLIVITTPLLLFMFQRLLKHKRLLIGSLILSIFAFI